MAAQAADDPGDAQAQSSGTLKDSPEPVAHAGVVDNLRPDTYYSHRKKPGAQLGFLFTFIPDFRFLVLHCHDSPSSFLLRAFSCPFP